MGLEKAKSLLELKDGMTFLDFIAKQVTDGPSRVSTLILDESDPQQPAAMRAWAAREQPRRPIVP